MDKRTRDVSFIDFWQLVASELGDARLLLNKNAKNIESLINTNSDVRAYLHRAIKKSYKLSHCENLNSPISLEHVLDTLGETAYRLQQEKYGDLFDIELLEEIAWLICDRYANQVSELVKREAAWLGTTQDLAYELAEEDRTFARLNSLSANKTRGPDPRATAHHQKATPSSSPTAARIISFPNYKIRKANAKL
jgi:hypothetical protein